MNISQAIELYKLLASRCENACENHQAKVYLQIADFISDCSSVEESMNKIKNSDYYLAPSNALNEDKAEAHKRAAVENKIPELAEIYKEKAPGYEQKALNIKNSYLNDMQIFTDIYRSYLSYLITDKPTYLDEISASKASLKTPFEKLAKNPIFRRLIPVNDAGYENFIKFEGVNYPDVENADINIKLDKHRVKVVAPDVGEAPKYKFIGG
ncbi:MAG: hypothetical protein Q4E88_04210 [Coriobacteriia bacterium]|nr:hypothetical protein [Coriobacteriia bacterium]